MATINTEQQLLLQSQRHIYEAFLLHRVFVFPHLYLALLVFPSWLLKTREGTCPKPVRTIKGALRKPLGLFQKASAAAFQCVRDILFAELTEVGDLAVLTLLLK